MLKSTLLDLKYGDYPTIQKAFQLETTPLAEGLSRKEGVLLKVYELDYNDSRGYVV